MKKYLIFMALIGISYYHDLRKDEQIMSRHQMRKVSVIIWCIIGYKGWSKVVFL